MTSWQQFVDEEPDMAHSVRQAFAVRKHCTMATLRADGAPRISGTEVQFVAGEVRLGALPDSRKVLDLRRDPRVAIHSPTVDPESANQWVGEAKCSGTAREIRVPDPAHDASAEGGAEHADGAIWFRVELSSVVFTGLTAEGDALRIQLWRPKEGHEVMVRH